MTAGQGRNTNDSEADSYDEVVVQAAAPKNIQKAKPVQNDLQTQRQTEPVSKKKKKMPPPTKKKPAQPQKIHTSSNKPQNDALRPPLRSSAKPGVSRLGKAKMKSPGNNVTEQGIVGSNAQVEEVGTRGSTWFRLDEDEFGYSVPNFESHYSN